MSKQNWKATAFIDLSSSKCESNHLNRGGISPRIAALALSASLLCSLGAPVFAETAASTHDRSAKDFKYRKRYIVPSSDLSRRIDYQAMPARDTLLLPTYLPHYDKPDSNSGPVHPAMNKTGSASSAGTGMPQVNRNGLKPPAPPVQSSLLPSSLTRDLNKTGEGSPTDTPHKGARLSAQRLNIIKTEAQGMVNKGHLADAQNMLNGYLRNYPHETGLESELARVSLKRAEAFSKSGSFDSAAQQARLAVSHGAIGQNAETELAARQILDQNLSKMGIAPSDAGARLELGEKLLSQNRYNEAEVEYKAAAHIKPTAAAYLGAGSAAEKQDRENEAKTLYQKALEVDPQSQEALKQLGLVRLKLKDFAGANSDLTRALVLDQNDREAADSLIGLWRNQVAMRPGDANSHLGLARAYQVSGDLTSAQAEYKTVVAIDPHHPNLPAARQSFKLALLRQEARKANDLAHSLEGQGSLSAAFQKATDAVELYPGESSYQMYRNQLGDKLRAQGLPAQAQSGVALAALSLLQQKGEAPPADSLPTAQAVGLTNQPPAVQNPSSGPFAHENMFHPVSTDQQVSSISGFLASLRNFSAQQQHQIGQAETASQDALRAIATGGGSSSISSGASGLPPGGLPSGLPTSGSGLPSGLPASASGLPATELNSAPAASQAPASASTPQDALKNAALALANTAGLRMTGGQAAVDTVNSFNSQSSGAAAAPAQSAGTAASAGAEPPAIALGQNAAGLMSNLKSMKQQGFGKTMSGLAQHYANKNFPGSVKPNPLALTTASKSVSVPAPQPAPAANPNSAYGSRSMPQTAPNAAYATSANPYYASQSNYLPPAVEPTAENQNAMPTLPQGSYGYAVPLPNNMAGQGQTSLTSQQGSEMAMNNINPAFNPAFNPGFVPPSNPVQNQTPGQYQTFNQNLNQNPNQYPNPNSAQNAPDLRGSINPLHLYLTGVKAAKSAVQLQVSLRNDTQGELKLPASLKAVLRTSGKADQVVKATFASRSVAAGAAANGTITVPGKSLDPGADVILPVDTISKGLPDLHLSVPISQRN